ncbi:MAG: murein biosynthesis integral membrane protein MurJ [Bordetella sp.]
MPTTLPSYRLFWFLGFIYASLMALMFQKVALPLLPGIYAGHGLLIHDPITAHNAAVTYANKIRELGWSQWKLFPTRSEGGNIGILSALYALFGPDPALFIPFNAAAEATCALMIYRLGSVLWSGRIGTTGGLVAAILFLVFPSSLQWYGQNLKDAFVIAGMLMMLYVQLRLLQQGDGHDVPRLPPRLLILMLGGAVLCAVFRPYMPILLLAIFGMCWVAVAVALGARRALVKERRLLAHGALALAVLVPIALFAAKSNVAETALEENGATTSEMSSASTSSTQSWAWQESAWLPHKVDHIFQRVSELRKHFAEYGESMSANSAIDSNRIPDSALGVLMYLPRALQIGLFAPFPVTWQQRVSAPRLVGALETSVWYLLFPGVLLLARRRPSRALLFGGCFSATLLVILSYINPNIGTLYRQRFGVWMLVLLAGAVGWISLLSPGLRRIAETRSDLANASKAALGKTDEYPGGGIESMVAAGSLVLIITLVCFLGFTARDLLLTREFGATSMMDGYFFAAMLPTFLIACVSMPMADALMRTFVESKIGQGLKQAEDIVRAVLWYGCLGMLGLSLLLYVCAEPLVRMGMSGRSADAVHSAVTMFRCFLPLLFLSIWTVVGNAVLSGLQRFRTVALTQLVVPVLAVGAIVIWPSTYGPYPAIFGMVAGALLHSLLIVWRLSRLGFVLWPRPSAFRQLPASVMRSYRRLALAALVGSAAIPIGYVIAGLVPGDGGVSAWALASKLITLFSSLASAAVAFVVLPHFSRLVRHHVELLRNDMRLLLVVGNAAGGVGTVMLGLFAVPIASALFSHGNTDERHILMFADILRIGALQLPVAITYTVMIKIAGVVGTSLRALAGSAIALVTNAVLAFVLVHHIGILGVAVASLVAMVSATLLLSTITRKACGLHMRDVAVLCISWIAWAGITLASNADWVHSVVS